MFQPCELCGVRDRRSCKCRSRNEDSEIISSSTLNPESEVSLPKTECKCGAEDATVCTCNVGPWLTPDSLCTCGAVDEALCRCGMKERTLCECDTKNSPCICNASRRDKRPEGRIKPPAKSESRPLDVCLCCGCNLPVPKSRCRCKDTVMPTFDMSTVPRLDTSAPERVTTCFCVDDEYPFEVCECPDSLEVRFVKMELCLCQGASACTCGKGLHFPAEGELCLCGKNPKITCDCDQSKPKRWGNKGVPVEPPSVLEPEHPLLGKFQETLRGFLLHENERLNLELLELEGQLKKRKKTYDEHISRKIYTFEREVNDQRQTILGLESKLEEASTIRKEKEARKDENINKHKKLLNNQADQRRKEREIREEMNALNALIRQFLEWQADTESDLTISQRISEKMAQEKRTRAEEKRKLDMFIYKLTTQIWHAETQIATLNDQRRVKEAEVELQGEKVALATADLNGIHIEKRRLMQVWQSIIILIGQRDKVYSAVTAEYKELQEAYRTLEADYESIYKIVQIEMLKHKGITVHKDRAIHDINQAKKNVENELMKQRYLDDKLMEYSNAVEITEKDLEACRAESTKIGDRDMHMKMQKLTMLKTNMENEILSLMENRLASDKAVEGLVNSVKQLREKSRKQELAILLTENQSAKIQLQLEKAKIKLARCTLILYEEQKAVDGKQQEVKTIEQEAKQIKLHMDRKQRELDIANTKILQMSDRLGTTVSPMERKILDVEKQLQEQKIKVEEMQQNWLRVQGHCVQLTTQYHEQMENINLIHKQIQIMEQKNAKFNADIDVTTHERNLIQRSLDDLQSKLQTLSKQRCDDKVRLEQIELMRSCLTKEYMAQLKDAEIEIINLEESISNLEKEKQGLNVDLNAKQKEALIWQRKGMTAVEAKAAAEKAKSTLGDVGKMKTEIHRMHVRQMQLKRISHKLSMDLLLCIHRRESHSTRARAQAAARTQPKPRVTNTDRQIRRHLAELTKEINRDQKQIENILEEQSSLIIQLESKKQALERLEKHIASIEKDIEEKTIEKYWNFEKIVRNQRYGQGFLALAEGRTKLYSEKSEMCIHFDHKKLNDTTVLMIEMIKQLADDLPEVKSRLAKIINTLNVEVATG